MPHAVHTLIYRVGVGGGTDSRVDRHNIALLKKICKKSTTSTSLEIYYHESTLLSHWAEGEDGVRYTRLRSGKDFPLAERIAHANAEHVLVLDGSLLLTAGDVWQLMARVKAQPVVALYPSSAVRTQHESIVRFTLRGAVVQKNNYLKWDVFHAGILFAVQKSAASADSLKQVHSVRESISYWQYLQRTFDAPPESIQGKSKNTFLPPRLPYLTTWSATIDAFQFWRKEKKLPHWFSQRFLLFLVAQLSSYCGVLALYVAPVSSLPFFIFAVLLTPQFFFARLSWRKPHHALMQVGGRFVQYLVG